MKKYLETLIVEKGVELEAEIKLEGHIGLTWQMLVDFISQMEEYHQQIRRTLLAIDYRGGDVFHYLRHLAEGMVAAC